VGSAGVDDVEDVATYCRGDMDVADTAQQCVEIVPPERGTELVYR
jgi:hypothetical protein